jgi:hypothetical protein
MASSIAYDLIESSKIKPKSSKETMPPKVIIYMNRYLILEKL